MTHSNVTAVISMAPWQLYKEMLQVVGFIWHSLKRKPTTIQLLALLWFYIKQNYKVLTLRQSKD